MFWGGKGVKGMNLRITSKILLNQIDQISTGTEFIISINSSKLIYMYAQVPRIYYNNPT